MKNESQDTNFFQLEYGSPQHSITIANFDE